VKAQKHTPALLMLADGTSFEGIAIGAAGTSTGEICFNTGMTGYQEIYTDPSYYGQIVVNTHPHIGNYGVIGQDEESLGAKIAGMVCNNFSELYSRNVADGSLQDYLQKQNIVAIAQIDTRHLVRHIRHQGAMNAIISSEITDLKALQARLLATPSMEGLELSSQVSTSQAYEQGEAQAGYKIAALDLGIKQNILNHLVKRHCRVRVFPAKTSFEEMEAWQPDGYFISNGPGDPAAMPYAVATVQQILQKTQKPLFGICLGHQILALANGIGTYKMHHGHRGLNHPVKNLLSGKSEITSQNHGFGVKREDVEKNSAVQITHINLNDQSIEGLRMRERAAFSVQYHPEASPGPHDASYLFDQFIEMLAKAAL
jgi:carbamoyl-phosphate synthase small subunit